MAAAFSGGPLGNGRMASVGPSPWQVAIVAALEIGIAAAVTAGAANWWYVRKRWPEIRRADAAGATGAAWSGDPPPAVAVRQRHAEYEDYEDSDAGHTIYLNRWAQDEVPEQRGRPRGPSALP